MGNVMIKIWNGEEKYLRWISYAPLAFLSGLYQIGLYLRQLMYQKGFLKTDQVSIPVISVGNISLGGSGKTPVVERLVRRLKDEGFNPGIITRGYKREKKGVFAVDIRNDSARSAGDEAYMLAKRTRIPVIVGSRRSEAIACGIHDCLIDIAILDDGFQVNNLEKDVEILVVNDAPPGASRGLFPLGPYREHFSRLRDAHAIIVNKGAPGKDTVLPAVGIPTFRAQYKPVHLYDMKNDLVCHYNFLNGKRIAAFSGLGDNKSFFNLLKDLGANVVRATPFQDHYRYTQADLNRCCSSWADVDCVVTTEKDAVKLALLDIPEGLFFLSIEAVIEEEDHLLELVLKTIGTQAHGFMRSQRPVLPEADFIQ